MKYVSLFFLLLSVAARGQNGLGLAMGTGVAVSRTGFERSPLFDLQVTYTHNRLVMGFVQEFATGRSGPAFFKAQVGAVLGKSFLVIPYAGYSYKLISTDVKSLNARGAVYGCQLNLPLRRTATPMEWLYLDGNRSNGFFLLAVGIKGKFGRRKC